MSGAPPLEPLAPGNFDRAWNDPPLFSYSSSATSQAGATKLTKRIGFPASANVSIVGQDPTAPPSLHDAGAKPPSCCVPPPPSDSTIVRESSSASSAKVCLATDKLEELLLCLTKENFPPGKATELDKRLSNLVTAHRNNSLGNRVPGLIGDLVEALSNHNIPVALSCFATLSADHGGDSGNAQWMIALRHLVTKVEEQHAKEESKEAITAPL